MIMLRNPNDTTQDNLMKFWTSFNTWIDKSENVSVFYKTEYTRWDNWDGGTYYSAVNLNEEYKIFYGEEFPRLFDKQIIQLDEMKDYIEIMYERWILPDKHYSFTVEVNKMFSKYSLPFKLSSGKVIGQGYKTTETVDIILNYRMFERKIAYSEEMIMSSEMLDKKSALDYIVDALQYYISVQDAENIDKKYATAAQSVNADQNTKVYAVVKKEIDEIMKISNEYFDIRHNEYLNKTKEKREPLDDLQFVEYLYNRAYSLLYLLRLKAKKETLISEKE